MNLLISYKLPVCFKLEGYTVDTMKQYVLGRKAKEKCKIDCMVTHSFGLPGSGEAPSLVDFVCLENLVDNLCVLLKVCDVFVRLIGRNR